MFNDDTPDWIRNLYQDAYPTAPIYPVGPRNNAARVMSAPAMRALAVQSPLQQSPQQPQMPWQMAQSQQQLPQQQPLQLPPWQTTVNRTSGVTDVPKNVQPQQPVNTILQNLQNLRHNINPQAFVTRAPVRQMPFTGVPSSQVQSYNFNVDPGKFMNKGARFGVPNRQILSDFASLSNRRMPETNNEISREDILRFLSSPEYRQFRGGVPRHEGEFMPPIR